MMQVPVTFEMNFSEEHATVPDSKITTKKIMKKLKKIERKIKESEMKMMEAERLAEEERKRHTVILNEIRDFVQDYFEEVEFLDDSNSEEKIKKEPELKLEPKPEPKPASRISKNEEKWAIIVSEDVDDFVDIETVSHGSISNKPMRFTDEDDDFEHKEEEEDCRLSADESVNYDPDDFDFENNRLLSPWRAECEKLLNDLWRDEDSEPFRHPIIDDVYQKEITVPMCLEQVKEQLVALNYHNLREFDHDMCLIFDNSKRYNSKLLKIYEQTEKLEAIYKSRIEEIMMSWQISRKNESLKKRKFSCMNETILDSNEYHLPSKQQKLTDENIDDEAGPSDIQSNESLSEYDDDEDKVCILDCQKHRIYSIKNLIDNDDDEDIENSSRNANSNHLIENNRNKTNVFNRASRRGSLHRKPAVEPLPVQFTSVDYLTEVSHCAEFVHSVVGRVTQRPHLKEETYVHQTQDYHDILEFNLECSGGEEVCVKVWDSLARIYHGYIKVNKVLRMDSVYLETLNNQNQNQINYELRIKNCTDVFVISEKTGKRRKLSKSYS